MSDDERRGEEDDELADSMAAMRRSQARLDEAFALMQDSHRRTMEKFDAFIGVLEGYIAEDRKRKAGGEGSA